MKKKKGILKGEKGFTLIEIIAVLIILGILAAVAVPRYMSLMSDARDSAAMAAVAEGKARVNQWAAGFILTGATHAPPTVAQAVAASTTLGTDAGDFSLGYTTSATGVVVTATGVTGGPAAGGTASGTVGMPTT